MLDEKKIVKIVGGTEKELELKADFRAFKNLQKITGNAFEAINKFAMDVDDRLDLLPKFIKAMSSTEMTENEIEDEFLTLSYSNVVQMMGIIFKILDFEMGNEVKTEEKVENTKSKTKETSKKN